MLPDRRPRLYYPGTEPRRLVRPAAGVRAANIATEIITLPEYRSYYDQADDYHSAWSALAVARDLANLRAITYRELDESGAWRRKVAAIAEYTDFLDLIEFGDASGNVIATLAINHVALDLVPNLEWDTAAYTFGTGNRWITDDDGLWVGGAATKVRRRSVTTPAVGGIDYHDATYAEMSVQLLFVPQKIKIE
jgi:hypothetical protein